MTDLSHLNGRMKKHDVTVKHINNTLNLAVLGKTNIVSMLDSDYRRGYIILFILILINFNLKFYF